MELDPELQHTCSHLEQHEMAGKGCGYFVRKQEQERAASPALKARRVLLGSSQLDLTALSTGALQQSTRGTHWVLGSSP